MSLDCTKLEKVVELADGAKRARCPACAESGQDRKGEHLRIYPDGKFGCCVHAGDRDHRKRIFALAGIRERQAIRVKVAGPKAPAVLQSGVLGRLGRVFGSVAKTTANITTEVGTPGTGQYIYTHEQESPEKEENNKKLIEFEPCVPNVPAAEVRQGAEIPVPSVPLAKSPETIVADGEPERLPFLTADGTLSIPFDSPERYHWWKPDGERLSVAETLAEVRAGLASASRTCEQKG
jgi:hypothetical protein